MREWITVGTCNVIAWISALITMSDVSIAVSTLATIISGVAAIVVAISRIKINRYQRLLAARQLCRECQSSEHPIIDCGTPDEYCPRNRKK